MTDLKKLRETYKKYKDSIISEGYSDNEEGVRAFMNNEIEGGISNNAQISTDPVVDSVWLVIDDDHKRAFVVYLNEIDAEEVDYEQAKSKYGNSFVSDSINEAEPVRSEKDIELLRRLGYSDDRIGRIDRSESETILMHRIPANKMGESIELKESAFWTEVNENLFNKALLSEYGPKRDINIDNNQSDQYNRYEDVIFLQGDEANEVIHIINQKGPDNGLEHLTQYHYAGEHETRDEKPHGTDDNVFSDGGYFMYWNNNIPYAGLIYDTKSGEGID